jgi:hypothetical protein
MGVQRVAAGVCAVAGVALLAGVGWSLLAAALLLAISSPGPWLASLRVPARRWWRRVVAAPRRAGAAVAVFVAVPLLALGFYFVAGLGAAILAGAFGLGCVGLLAGWNQPQPTA